MAEVRLLRIQSYQPMEQCSHQQGDINTIGERS